MLEAYRPHHADVVQNLHRLEVSEPFSQKIETQLNALVVGQPDATKAIARRLSMLSTGFTDPTRPLGAILSSGPSGVGKTEAAKASAKVMFGDKWEERFKIINCAEFSEKHTVARLVGSPPGYVGYGEKGVISHDWLHKGRSVIVFDEFEKADPALHKLALSILEEGNIQARNGSAGEQPLNFNQSLLFFTTNVGSSEIQHINDEREIGFSVPNGGDRQKRMQAAVTEQLSHAFAPEFRNRLTDIVLFQNLEPCHMQQIFWTMLSDKNKSLLSKNVNAPRVEATEEMCLQVVQSLDKAYGARNMRQVMDRQIYAPLADYIMGLNLARKTIVATPETDGVTGFYTDDSEPFIEEPLVQKKKTPLNQPAATPTLPSGKNPLRTDEDDDPNDGTNYHGDPGDEHQPPAKKIGDGRGGEKDDPNDPPENILFVNARLTLQTDGSENASWVTVRMPVFVPKPL